MTTATVQRPPTESEVRAFLEQAFRTDDAGPPASRAWILLDEAGGELLAELRSNFWPLSQKEDDEIEATFAAIVDSACQRAQDAARQLMIDELAVAGAEFGRQSKTIMAIESPKFRDRMGEIIDELLRERGIEPAPEAPEQQERERKG